MSINVISLLKMIVDAYVVFISYKVIYILSKLRFSTNKMISNLNFVKFKNLLNLCVIQVAFLY